MPLTACPLVDRPQRIWRSRTSNIRLPARHVLRYAYTNKVGVAVKNRKDIIQKITDQFHTDTRPEFGALVPGYNDELEAFMGKGWEDLSLRDFVENPWALTSMPKVAFAYYFGAYLVKTLSEGEFDLAPFEYLADISPASEIRGQRNISNIIYFANQLTDGQLVTFSAYLKCCAEFLEPALRTKYLDIASEIDLLFR